jgi:hypothetical protein
MRKEIYSVITLILSLEDYLNILTALRSQNNPQCDALISTMARALKDQIMIKTAEVKSNDDG